MANFSKVKEFAIMVDSTKGFLVKKVDKNELDSTIHDVVEGWFEPIYISFGNVKEPGNNLVILVNEEAKIKDENMPLNPFATVITRGLVGRTFILGNAVILRKNRDTLEPFTKEEAMDLVVAFNRRKGII